MFRGDHDTKAVISSLKRAALRFTRSKPLESCIEQSEVDRAENPKGFQQRESLGPERKESTNIESAECGRTINTPSKHVSFVEERFSCSVYSIHDIMRMILR
jgi:hypothetical protein